MKEKQRCVILFFSIFIFSVSISDLLLLKSLKIFTMGNVLQFSADHHAGWPLCKLWEHRFSVPDLVSPPRPPPRRTLCGKFCFSGRLRPTGAADPGLRCRVLKVPGCWSCPKDQGNDCNACSSEDLTMSCMAASWAMVKGPAWTRSGKS